LKTYELEFHELALKEWKKLDGSVHFHDLAHILFDQALLAEGGLPADPAAYVKRVNALLS